MRSTRDVASEPQGAFSKVSLSASLRLARSGRKGFSNERATSARCMQTVSFLAVATLSLAFGWPAAVAQEANDEQLGRVHFQTSCNEVAQRRFDRGLRYQHSFWYRPAKEVFEETLKADSECVIALWGIGLSLLSNPHFAAPKENLVEGLAALQKAKAIGAKTERERDYIDALLAFYSGDEKLPFGQRVQTYLKATETLASRYPSDDEAQIAYAITLNVAASPNDKTYANQLKGAAILEPIFKRQPRHPGVAHYLIHLYDYPPIAEKGLDAAQRYARSPRQHPTRSICLPTFLRASAIGRNPSTRIAVLRWRRKKARSQTSSCTLKTTLCMPTSNLRKTRRRAKWSTT